MCRYAPIEPISRDEVAERLADPQRTRSTLEREGDALNLAVEHAASAQMIGDLVLFWRSAAHRQGEIGYTVNPSHQGHGYATEAAAALIDLAIEGLGLHRVTARKGEWITLTEWAILEHEWRSSRPLAGPAS